MDSYAVIKRNAESAQAVQRILRLPDDHWTEVQVGFGTDTVATVVLTLLITGEQLQALAAVAFQHNVMAEPTHDHA